MNLVGRVNIKINEVLSEFPNSPNAAARDLQHQSSNITFFRLVGTLSLFGWLFAVRYIAIGGSLWLNSRGLDVGAGAIGAVLLFISLVTFWFLFFRRWRQQQNNVPEMSSTQQALVQAFKQFEDLAKRPFPGVSDCLKEMRRLLLRTISKGDDLVFHRLTSQLVHLSQSKEFLELVAGNAEFEAGLRDLNTRLMESLEGKELLPLQADIGKTERVNAFNAVTTQTF